MNDLNWPLVRKHQGLFMYLINVLSRNQLMVDYPQNIAANLFPLIFNTKIGKKVGRNA
jgi:hypothetical protein